MKFGLKRTIAAVVGMGLLVLGTACSEDDGADGASGAGAGGRLPLAADSARLRTAAIASR